VDQYRWKRVTRGPEAEDRLAVGRAVRDVCAKRSGLRLIHVHSKQQTRAFGQNDYFGGRDR